LIEQSRSRLAGLLAPYDQPSLEQFQKGTPTPATAEELPGEAGKGGMVGRPQTEAEKLYPTEIPEKIPLPQARPATADVSPATEIYPGDNPPRPGMIVPKLGTDYRGRDVTMVEQRLRRAVEGGAQFLPPGYWIEPTSGYQGRETSQGQHSGKHAEDFRIHGPDGVIPNSGPDYTGMYTLLGRGVKTWVGQNDPSLDRDMRWGAAFETSKGSGRGDTMHFDTGMAHGTPYQGNLNPNSQWVGLQPLSAAEQNAMPAYIPLLGDNQVPLDGRVPTGRGSSYSANPARFGGFGASEFSGQDPSAGAFTPFDNFRQGGRFEDRTAEQIGQDNLKALEQRGFGYDPRLTPEQPLTPLGEEAGLNTLAGGKYTPEPSGTLPSDRLSTDPVAETAKRLGQLSPRDPNSPVEYRTANPLVNITKQDIGDAMTLGGAFTGDVSGRLAKLAIAAGAAATPGVDTSLSDQPHPDPTELLRGVGTSNAAPLFFAPLQAPEQGATFKERFSGEPNRFDNSIFDQSTYGDTDPGASYALGRDALARLTAPDQADAGAAAETADLPGEAGRGGMTGRPIASEANTFGRPKGDAAAEAINRTARIAGMSPEQWAAIAQIESDINPESNRNNKKTQYKGLYQIGDNSGDSKEWRDWGMGDIYNPGDNAETAARIFQGNAEWFKNKYGRDPTVGEAYLMHNQGRGFFTNNTMTNIAKNIPSGAGFTPAAQTTHDKFLADWTRHIDQKASKLSR
jgi:hypothetical protein